MRKVMTKLVAAALAATMLAACGGTSGNAGSDTSTTTATTDTQKAASNEAVIGDFVTVAKDGVVDMSFAGLKFTLPEDLAKGDYSIAGWARVNYENMWGRLWICDPNKDLINQVSHPGFFEIFGISSSTTLDEYVASVAPEGTTQDVLDKYKECHIDLGSNGAYRYYLTDTAKMTELLPDLVGTKEDELKFYAELGIDQSRVDQAMALQSYSDQIIAGMQIVDLTMPKMQKASDIDTSALAALTLQDINGNKVKLGDIFAKNKLTMLDIWKTDCTVCVQEMPDLEQLSKKYADKGFGILSVCVDVVDNNGNIDDDLLYDAQDIVKSTGISYPTVLADKQFRSMIDVVSTPTILWVDSKGNIVDGPQRGSYGKDMTATIIEKNLEKVQ